MDVRTEQAYQQRIAAPEACVVDLETQLAQRDATIAALQQQVAALSKQVVDLLAQVARLSKNSSNSSKPPSSDIVKPPPSPPALSNNAASLNSFTKLSAITSPENQRPLFFRQGRERVPVTFRGLIHRRRHLTQHRFRNLSHPIHLRFRLEHRYAIHSYSP